MTDEDLVALDEQGNWQFESTKDVPLARLSPEAFSKLMRLGYSTEDYIEQFPCFLGARYLSRFISIYECYRKTLGIEGHIAEVGVYKGAVSLLLAKLMLMFEPLSKTQVHAFDWWRAAQSEDEEGYFESYERIKDMIDVQGLQRYVLLHRMNIQAELSAFFTKYKHLQFKFVFLDAGEYETVKKCINEFWPRLSNGGILVFDQFNHEVAPGETLAARELLPEDCVIRTFEYGWMPTSYVVKGEKIISKN